MQLFEWDPEKARENRKKHSISFEIAATAFDDPLALVIPDDSHSSELEFRQWLVGRSDRGILIVVFTVRGSDNIYRIISARKADLEERRNYYAQGKYTLA